MFPLSNLAGLQNAFDVEWNRGYIKQEGWNQSASNDAILAYKLMVQTGRVDNPVDKSLLTSNRLVKEDGIINPKAFYHYLTAWYNSDPLAYSTSQVRVLFIVYEILIPIQNYSSSVDEHSECVLSV